MPKVETSHEKKSGVVKMGLNDRPVIDKESVTGVVRPKPPKDDDDGTKTALSAARKRTGA